MRLAALSCGMGRPMLTDGESRQCCGVACAMGWNSLKDGMEQPRL